MPTARTEPMALKATIYKALVHLADMDRNVYRDEEVTLARHPSETDVRVMVRLLVYALNLPESDDDGTLTFAKDLWEADEPALWLKDLTGRVTHWIELGQPEEKRLNRLLSKATHVSVYAFNSNAAAWWTAMQGSLDHARNLTVWQIPAEQGKELGALAERSLEVDVTVQEGAIWMGVGKQSVEVGLVRLFGKS